MAADAGRLARSLVVVALRHMVCSGASVLRIADPLQRCCPAKALAPVRLDGANCRPNGSQVVVQMPWSAIFVPGGHPHR